jgi:N-acetylmuramoyl-L-alanine amidase
MYQAALDREAFLTGENRPTPPSLEQLNNLIAQYQQIVHKYPRSGYSDNALWQAAGLAFDAFHRYGDSKDRIKGERFLELIKSEYPSSSLAPQIDSKLKTLISTVKHQTTSSTTTLLRHIERTPMAELVRITIELDAEVTYHQEQLDGPPRLFFDLKKTETPASLHNTTLSYTDDIVRKIRLGRHPTNTTRIVFDLNEVASYSVYPQYNPYRLVVDFTRKDNQVVVALSPQPTPATPTTNSNGDFSLSRQLGLGISRIVIDPGHGGHDPGTRGSGLTEADVVLDVALRVKDLLANRRTIDVILTRDTDIFIPLKERTAIANRHGADLFLSIHANANNNRKVRGVETYFLNFASDSEAEALAARENSASEETMRDLQGLVERIALNNKLDESRDLAEMVQQTMHSELVTINTKLRNLGVKQAPFVVLIGAEMPSVLAEISFLSNRAESLLLKTDAYRQAIAQGLVQAILRYQESLKSYMVAEQP